MLRCGGHKLFKILSLMDGSCVGGGCVVFGLGSAAVKRFLCR